jgi:hypothetical protein
MLVHEYVPNGNLKDGLSGTSILFLTFFYLIEFLYLLTLEVIKELGRRQYILFLFAKETKKSHSKNQ